jgi:hypothetical protein
MNGRRQSSFIVDLELRKILSLRQYAKQETKNVFLASRLVLQKTWCFTLLSINSFTEGYAPNFH